MESSFYRLRNIRKRIKHHFGTDNRAKVTNAILRWLFQSPTPAFLNATRRHQTDTLGPALAGPFVAFQLRSWVDVAPKFTPEIMARNSRALVDQFDRWHDGQVNNSDWAKHSAVGNDNHGAKLRRQKRHAVYLTSDSLQGIAALSNALHGNLRIGEVKTATKFFHTGHVHAEATSGDRVPELGPGPVSSALVDWYVLGGERVDAVFCSGTTFCVSAIARLRTPPGEELFRPACAGTRGNVKMRTLNGLTRRKHCGPADVRGAFCLPLRLEN